MCVYVFLLLVYLIDFSLLSALTRISFSFKECIITVSLKLYLTVSIEVWIIVSHIDGRINNNSNGSNDDDGGGGMSISNSSDDETSGISNSGDDSDDDDDHIASIPTPAIAN